MEENDLSNKCNLAKTYAIPETNMSHKQKKALLKKQKRKLQRQTLAKERDKKLQLGEEGRTNSPSYNAKLQQEEDEVTVLILQLEEESRRQRELWEWSEEVYKERLKQKEEQEERERLNRLEMERKIKEEWEERQKQEKKEEEDRQKKKEKEEEMLRQARQGENKDGDWHNPLAPVQYGQERVVEQCPFFAKVGACRFGDRCSRGHPYPETGRSILFTNMFRHFQLDQGLCEEYDTDIVLEYEDSEVRQKFSEFYEDTLPEFKNIGQVTQFKVSCNFQPHLRGNVYVSYAREDEALKAYTQFNARWYAGKQISAQFVEIPSWKRAICGLFGRGRCPKGRECNFLHVFKNPNGEFSFADRDIDSFTPRHRNGWHNNASDRQSKYRRSASRSHRRHRSRSSDRYKSVSRRSHSRDKKYYKKEHNRSSSRYSRSKSKERSRSRERSKTYKRSKSRERLQINKQSRFREKSETSGRSRSKSNERLRHSLNISRSKSKKQSNHRHSRSRSTSPIRSSHKHKRRKQKQKYSSSSSDEEKSDFEEVWVERTTDNKQINVT